MKKFAMAAALFVMTLSTVAAQDAAKAERFGAGVTLKDAVSLTELYRAPESFVGKTIRVDGVVNEVCTEMGCWMAIASASETEPGLLVRIKVDHGAGIVFPITARGKKVSAEGVFEKIAADDKEGQEAAAEQTSAGAKAAAFGKAYQLKGLGAYVY